MMIFSAEDLTNQSTVLLKHRPSTETRMLVVWSDKSIAAALFDKSNGMCYYAAPVIYWMEGMRLTKVLKIIRKRKMKGLVRDDV